MVRIAVLVSGGGTNLQKLLDAQQDGLFPQGEIVFVLSSNPNAYALERAKNAGIASAWVRQKEFDSFEEYDSERARILKEQNIDLVVLAGYLGILGKKTLALYGDKIINVHPALTPSFCGKSFYGLRVHEAVLEAGVKVTGATVHLVNEVVDGGKILLQKAVEVLPDDTPESLQKRVMEQGEWVLLPQAVAMMCAQIEAEKQEKNA